MVVVVADAVHQRGVAGGEHGVALVLRIGAQQVEAHQVALAHGIGVGQQRVEQGQRGVWPGVHQRVGTVHDSRLLPRRAGEYRQHPHQDDEGANKGSSPFHGTKVQISENNTK